MPGVCLFYRLSKTPTRNRVGGIIFHFPISFNALFILYIEVFVFVVLLSRENGMCVTDNREIVTNQS